jgi:hypothetical protein
MSQPNDTRQSGSKSFPWRCPNCLRSKVRLLATNYTTQAVTIPADIPTCTACGERVFDNDTCDRITEALSNATRQSGSSSEPGTPRRATDGPRVSCSRWRS